MGREAKIIKSQIEKIDPKDTFDPTTPSLEVNARRTDPYVDPGRGEAGNIAALMSFTKDINSSLQLFDSLQDRNKADNAAKAKADQMQGIYDKPSGIFNLGRGYDETWHTVHGEAQAWKVNEEAQRVLKENNYFVDLPDEEARKKRDEIFEQIYQKHFDGIKHPYALAGASEIYHRSRLAVLTQSEAALAEKNVNIAINDLGGRTNVDFQSGMNNNNLAPQDMMKQFEAGWNEIKPGFQNIITRDRYTQIGIEQIDSILWDLTNNDGISTTEAKKKGDKLIALMKTPTSNGRSWGDITTDGGKYKFREAIQKIENNFITGLARKDAADEKKLNKEQEMNKSTLKMEFREAGKLEDITERENSVLAIVKKADELRLKGKLSMEDHDSILEYSDRLLKGELIPEDTVTKSKVLRLAERAEITDKEVERQLMLGKINVSTANLAYGKIDSHKKWLVSRADQKNSDFKADYNFNLGHVKNVVDNLNYTANPAEKAIVAEKVVNATNEFDILVKDEGMSPRAAAAKVIENYRTTSEKDRITTFGNPIYKKQEDLVNQWESGKISQRLFDHEWQKYAPATERMLERVRRVGKQAQEDYKKKKK